MEFIDLTEDHSEDEVVCLGITAKIESNDEGMLPDDERNVMNQSMKKSEDDHTYIQLNGSAEGMIQSSTESDDESKHSSESEVDSDRYMALFMLTLLAAIANHGMPSCSGRKGGVPKRKRSHVTTPIQTRSVRQCLQQNSSPAPSSATLDSPRQQPNITAGFEQGTQKPLSNTNPNPTPVTETVKQPFNHLTSGSQLIVSNSGIVVGGNVRLTTIANLFVILDLLLHCLPTL